MERGEGSELGGGSVEKGCKGSMERGGGGRMGNERLR